MTKFKKYLTKPRMELQSNIKPTRPIEVVFNKECEDGIPELYPARMWLEHKHEFELLSRIYDWWLIQRRGGAPFKLLHTQRPKLHELRDKGLVEQRDNPNFWQLTTLGRRVYELNYWLRVYNARHARLRMYREQVKREARLRYGNMPNPKPLTHGEHLRVVRDKLTPQPQQWSDDELAHLLPSRMVKKPRPSKLPPAQPDYGSLLKVPLFVPTIDEDGDL